MDLINQSQRLLKSLSWILGEKVDEELEDRDKIARERFERLGKMIRVAESEGKRDQDRTQSVPPSRGPFPIPLPLNTIHRPSLAPGAEDNPDNTATRGYATARPLTKPGEALHVIVTQLVPTDAITQG